MFGVGRINLEGKKGRLGKCESRFRFRQGGSPRRAGARSGRHGASAVSNQGERRRRVGLPYDL